jgi:hypothetical protein
MPEIQNGKGAKKEEGFLDGKADHPVWKSQYLRRAQTE